MGNNIYADNQARVNNMFNIGNGGDGQARTQRLAEAMRGLMGPSDEFTNGTHPAPVQPPVGPQDPSQPPVGPQPAVRLQGPNWQS
jgi:hypothetical protein